MGVGERLRTSGPPGWEGYTTRVPLWGMVPSSPGKPRTCDRDQGLA